MVYTFVRPWILHRMYTHNAGPIRKYSENRSIFQYLLLYNMQDNLKTIECCVCRNRQPATDISYIKSEQSVPDSDSQKIIGNFSTKIEAIIKLILRLKSEEPSVKILVFSSWSGVLKHLQDAMKCNLISCEMVSSSTTIKSKVELFKVRQ